MAFRDRPINAVRFSRRVNVSEERGPGGGWACGEPQGRLFPAWMLRGGEESPDEAPPQILRSVDPGAEQTPMGLQSETTWS